MNSGEVRPDSADLSLASNTAKTSKRRTALDRKRHEADMLAAPSRMLDRGALFRR